MGKKLSNYVIFDFETGGLKSEENPVCEVAMIAIKGDTFEEIGRYEAIVQNYNDLEYTPQAMNVHGITMNQINNGATIQEMVQGMTDLFKKANDGMGAWNKGILIGHNGQFDISFLNYAFNYCKKDLSKVVASSKEDGYPAFLDTMWLSRMKWNNDNTMTHFKLSDCISKAEVDLVDAHRAMNDVISTKDLFVKLTKDMRSNAVSVGDSALEERYRTNFEL